MYYDFVTTTTITSNAAKVITDAGTTLIQGSLTAAINDTASKSFVCNGTTHVAVTSNGTTTGGILGSAYRLTAISSTLWQVSGAVVASGTVTIPCATS